ncbi:unnamed protein product [Miscanthus lutarioriparius]|uniref:GAG-pre-integrase domain-containing protein n=1 Tax=Miscanthus lutarioriparius TaxID=422564 RepID=A0A811RKA0_9POAL|nr:unnamed protein product [Miscanthus lutarioriparius]
MEALNRVLKRSGGVLPFLQAAIDVAHHRSGLFRDPSAVSKVTSMAAAIRAWVEAEKRAAREAERKAPAAEEPESLVEKDCICMVVDKKQVTVAEQGAELEATTAELEGRSLKLHEQLKELEAMQSSEVEQKHIALVTEVATLQSTFNANWILDSGASRHVTGTLDEFASYNSFPPALNLVSISALVDQMDCRVTLDRENCLIEDRKTGMMLGSGIRRNGLWFLDRRIDNSTCTALAISTSEEETKVILQHCRLGHMSFDTMSRAFPDIMSKVDKKKLVCDACEFGKHMRASYISKGLRSTLPFILVHSDVWTSPVVSISGMKYFVTFIDCYSRMTWVYLMRHKNEVLKDFCACVKNQFNTQGENEASHTREGDHQPRKLEIVIGTIPRPMDDPNLTSVEEGENSTVQSGPIQEQSRRMEEIVGGLTPTQPNGTGMGLQNRVISKVYTRRKFRSQQENTELIQTPTSELCPSAPVRESGQKIIDVSSTSEIDVENSSDALPIALRKGRKITVLAVYVDDIIITGDEETKIKCLKGNLSRECEVKDLGQLKYFLGIEIARNPKGKGRLLLIPARKLGILSKRVMWSTRDWKQMLVKYSESLWSPHPTAGVLQSPDHNTCVTL